MSARWLLPFALVFGLTTTRAAGPTITIDAASPSGKVSPLFYGLMTEEINHAYDGGLYAELVRNRAFLDDAASPAHWSVVQADGAAATIALDPKRAAQRGHRRPACGRRDAGLDRPRRRHRQRGLLGHSGQAEHALPRVVLREGRARIHRPDRRLDPEHDGRTIYATEDRRRSDSGLEAVRSDAADRQRDAHREGALRPDAGSPRHGLVQPGVAVPADLQESAERLPCRHHADAGRHEAEVPALPRRQLSRGRSDRRSLRVEEDARAARRIAPGTWRRGAIARPTAWACTSSCSGARTWTPSRCWPSMPATRSRARTSIRDRTSSRTCRTRSTRSST